MTRPFADYYGSWFFRPFRSSSHAAAMRIPVLPVRLRANSCSLSSAIRLKLRSRRSLQLALLLHDGTAPSGSALQLVDIQNNEVVSTLILDYFDVYDVEFISSTEACFLGRMQGSLGYAVQFFNIPSLTPIDTVVISDLSGTHGYLDVNDAGTIVYCTHAGGEDHDAVFAISVGTKLPYRCGR